MPKRLNLSPLVHEGCYPGGGGGGTPRKVGGGGAVCFQKPFSFLRQNFGSIKKRGGKNGKFGLKKEKGFWKKTAPPPPNFLGVPPPPPAGITTLVNQWT